MAEKQVKEKPLEKMTAKELREMALGLEGIVGVHSMNKPELIKAIKEAKGIKDEPGRKAVDPAAIREAKKKIKDLQAQRAQALEAGDKKRAEILRKKTSRLKKKTRRLAAAG